MKYEHKDSDRLTWLMLAIIAGILITVLINKGSNSEEVRLSSDLKRDLRIQNEQTSTKEGSGVKTEQSQIEPEEECVRYTDNLFSESEESRMNEIALSVGQKEGMPTIQVYNEFWQIVNSHGKLCDSEINLLKNKLTALYECNWFFYQDALYSITTRDVYKGPERLDCEQRIMPSLLSKEEARARVASNQDLMYKIANKQEIETPDGIIIFTEDFIMATLTNQNHQLERFYTLFSTTPPTSESYSVSDNDKECERVHGPSTYKTIRESLGGGAYCVCRPGYKDKPIRTSSGENSSWCFKE